MAVTLLVLRVAAPYVAAALINRQLAAQPGVGGSVDGVSMAILRGVYEVHGLRLDTRQPGAQEREPLLYVTNLRCGLHWSGLLRGQLTGDLLVDRPIFFVRPAAANASTAAPVVIGPADGKPPSLRWHDVVGNLAFFRIDDIRLSDGRIEYNDQPRGFTAWLGDLQGRVRDLSLGYGSGTRRAAFHLSGNTIGQGIFQLSGIVTPAAERPDIMLRAAIEGVELGRLNPISRHFDGLTFNSGTFSAYVEASISEGRLSGYVKPLFRHLDIATYRQDRGSAASKLFWRAVVPVAENVLDNDAKDQHAARVPLEGTVDQPGSDLWAVVGSTLGNAFVRALLPGFDGLGAR